MISRIILFEQNFVVNFTYTREYIRWHEQSYLLVTRLSDVVITNIDILTDHYTPPRHFVVNGDHRAGRLPPSTFQRLWLRPPQAPLCRQTIFMFRRWLWTGFRRVFVARRLGVQGSISGGPIRFVILGQVLLEAGYKWITMHLAIVSETSYHRKNFRRLTTCGQTEILFQFGIYKPNRSELSLKLPVMSIFTSKLCRSPQSIRALCSNGRRHWHNFFCIRQTAPCISQITLKYGLYRWTPSSPNFATKWPIPWRFECQRHLTAN